MADTNSFGFTGGSGSGGGGGGTLSSVGLSMPSAFTVPNSPLIANGVLNVLGAGTTNQYIDGTGALKTFPANVGGGSAVVYYLNGNVSQGTIGGNPYYQMSKIVNLGPNADFSINANGYVAQFITDTNDPQLPFIPAGAWQFQLYFSASSGGGNPRFYIEIYKYNGTTFTLIADNSTIPESITGGTNIDLYTTLVAMPQTALALTDRIAVRVYVIHSSRTITLHTEGPHIDKVTTTFTYGVVSINGLTDSVQYLQTGTAGTDFGITQSGLDTHVFNLPVASATNTGKLSNTDWSTFNNKQNSLTFGNLTESTSNVLQIFSGTGAVIGAGTQITVKQAGAGQSGYLSQTDWNTFNNKQNALTFGTAGSVQFSSGSALDQDSSNFFWNNSNKRLGIGTNTPSETLEVNGNLKTSNGGMLVQGAFSVAPTGAGFELEYAIGVAYVTSYNRTSSSWLPMQIRASNIDLNSAATTIMSISSSGVTIFDKNIILGSTTGTQIGTAINQRLSFYGSTPTTQPVVSTRTLQGLADKIKDLGLISFTGTFETTINLTQTGSSGPASWTAATNTLNIPDYSTAFSGFVPTSRTISTTAPLQGGGDLSADRTLSITQSSGSTDGYLSSADWTTFNNKQNAITLSVTGNSGPATFIANTLNIPTYTLSGLGGQPLNANLTGLSSLTYVSGTPFVKMTAAGTFALDTNTYLTSAITSLNGLTGATQTFATGTSGTDFGISSVGTTHTFNLPTASATNRGALSSADWTTFNSKVSSGDITTSGLTMNTSRLLGRTTAGSGAVEEIQVTFTGTSGSATFSGGILNIPNYSGAGYITSVWNVTTQTGASYNASNNDYVVINATTFTLNLPSIASAGVRIGVKMVAVPSSSTAIQVLTNTAAQTIDGQTSNVLNATTNLYIYNQWDAYTLVSYSDGGVFKWAIES
jgi:hypothetical protein